MIILQRKLGLDALRVITMLMIVALHYFFHGGMLNIIAIKNLSNVITWGLEAAFIVAVNCYVFISSYFLVKSQFKIKKIIKLVVEVLFYSILIYIIFVLTGKKELTIDNIITNFLPILNKKYWFITVYLAMYVLSPFLNRLIYNMDKNTHKNLIIILICIFSIWPSVMPFADTFDKTNGYSLYWFIVIYFIGAYVRIYKDEKENKKYKYLSCYILIAAIMFVSKFILYYLYSRYKILKVDYSWTFYKYNSITVLASSFCLFMFFKNLNIRNKIISKIILITSPLTFGVYLIHDNPYVREILYTKILHTNNYFSSNKYLIVALLSIITVFTICSIIDYLRMMLFKLVVRVNINLNNKNNT